MLHLAALSLTAVVRDVVVDGLIIIVITISRRLVFDPEHVVGILDGLGFGIGFLAGGQKAKKPQVSFYAPTTRECALDMFMATCIVFLVMGSRVEWITAFPSWMASYILSSQRVLEAGQGTLVAVGAAGGGVVVGLVGTRRRCAAPSSNDTTPETCIPAMRNSTNERMQGR